MTINLSLIFASEPLNSMYLLWVAFMLCLMGIANASPIFNSTATYQNNRVESRAGSSKTVFAHYMVGTITQEHAHQDIDDAKAMGLDGFALNIGDPTQPFVEDTLHDLFGYAEYVGGFSLYISMDVYASGAACYAGSTSCNGPFDYSDILTWTLGSSAYFKGPNGFPMISTFSSGGFINETWVHWKETLANQMYFIPDFDETEGYYGGKDAYPGWYDYWGGVVDGIFSWESAWPKRGNPSPGTVGGAYPGDISLDLAAQGGAIEYNKGYMLGLSPLQYKDSYGTNIYRPGDVGMMVRMVNILAMEPSPDWIVIQTWNDGPESHYIGNLWPEQNTDRQPAAYMGADWPHTAWQPLIQAFIGAFKDGGNIYDMTPSFSEGVEIIPQGAMWYRTMLMEATCINDDGGIDSTGAEQYWQRPDGYDSGKDNVNWAVLMPPSTTGYTISVWSGGSLILSGQVLNVGLNYGTIPELNVGVQTMQILDAKGNVYMTASGGQCVSDGCPDYIYNMNYQVVPLALGSSAGSCVSSSTDIYVPPGVWTESDPEINCIPPCAIILPPLDLGYTTTMDFPPLTTSVWSVSGGSTITKTTTIDVPPLTTASIEFWKISVLATETASTIIYPLQSVLPPSIVVTLASNEATFAPTPSGSQQISPTFFASQHPVTFQPQATQSFPIASPAIPSLTFASAVPTAICTTGCGTDSCALFGGCNSDGSDECGTYGCDGGCGVQGCDTTCGISCSSDLSAPATDPLPIDIDGPNDTNDGSWLPKPIPASLMIQATQVVNSMVTSVAQAASDLTNNPSDSNQQSAVQNAASSASDAIQAQQTAISDYNSNSNPGFVDYLGLGSSFSSLLSDFAAIIQIAQVEGPSSSTAQQIENWIGSAQGDSASLNEEILEEGGIDTCTSGAAKRWQDASGQLFPRAGEVCGPTYTTDPGEPVNAEEIEDVDCVSTEGTNPWTRDQILEALKQGFRYTKTMVTNPSGNTVFEYSTRGQYPHFYGNSDGISFSPSCAILDGDVWGSQLIEFPIIKDGVLSVGRNNRGEMVGTDRVVFKISLDKSEYMFCGVMTHFTRTLVNAGSLGLVLPFKLC